MSDTPMEKKTNEKFIKKAYGDILIEGVGIGMILLPLTDKKEVRSVTVVEKYQEVIDLVWPQRMLDNRFIIINDDINSYVPVVQYDVIYLDIWSGINQDIYKFEMLPLKKRLREYLKDRKVSPCSWIGCWAEWNAKCKIALC